MPWRPALRREAAADSCVLFLALAPTALLLSCNLYSHSISTWRPLRARTSLHEVLCKPLHGLRILQCRGLLRSTTTRKGNLLTLLVEAGLCSRQRCISVLGSFLPHCVWQSQQSTEQSITHLWGMTAMGQSSNKDRHSTQWEQTCVQYSNNRGVQHNTSLELEWGIVQVLSEGANEVGHSDQLIPNSWFAALGKLLLVVTLVSWLSSPALLRSSHCRQLLVRALNF